MDDELTHDYDAIKRREYYLRNRKLKGRKHGSVKVAAPVKSRAQRQAERKKRQEAQIAALKGRLEKLRAVLSAETKKAQARSGVTSSTAASSAPESSSGNSPAQKLTAAQKAKKAAAEKKAREKNQTLDEQVKSLTEKIKTIQARIIKMRKDGSVGAKRTTTK